MPEPERPVSGTALQEPGIDRLTDRGRVDAELILEQPDVEVSLAGRRELDQLAGGRRQVRQPSEHEPAEVRRIDADPGPPGVDELLDQEGESLAQLDDPLPVTSFQSRCDLGDQRDEVDPAEHVQGDRVDHVGRSGRAAFLVTPRRDQQQPHRGEEPGKVRERVSRGSVAPLEVLDHPADESLLGQGLDQVRGCADDSSPDRFAARTRAQSRDQRSELLGVGTEGVAHPVHVHGPHQVAQ